MYESKKKSKYSVNDAIHRTETPPEYGDPDSR
jgi:hypothetical protein